MSQLVAPSPALDEAFGWSIDLDGDRIVVGARNGNAGAGAAYVYVRSTDGSWALESTLAGAGIDAGDEFAKSVSIVGDRVACGAPYYAAGCSASAPGAGILAKLNSMKSYMTSPDDPSIHWRLVWPQILVMGVPKTVNWAISTR